MCGEGEERGGGGKEIDGDSGRRRGMQLWWKARGEGEGGGLGCVHPPLSLPTAQAHVRLSASPPLALGPQGASPRRPSSHSTRATACGGGCSQNPEGPELDSIQGCVGCGGGRVAAFGRQREKEGRVGVWVGAETVRWKAAGERLDCRDVRGDGKYLHRVPLGCIIVVWEARQTFPSLHPPAK